MPILCPKEVNAVVVAKDFQVIVRRDHELGAARQGSCEPLPIRLGWLRLDDDRMTRGAQEVHPHTTNHDVDRHACHHASPFDGSYERYGYKSTPLESSPWGYFFITSR